MKLGILADIHGHVENLRTAIERLRRERVDQFIVLGDVIYDTEDATETVALLEDCGAIGVWGNHELGLCIDPDKRLQEMFDERVLEFCSKLHSRLEWGELLFSHTLPDQDPTDPVSYYLAPRPDEKGALDASFDRFGQRVMMIGHFHRWFATTPTGRVSWEGSWPLKLDANHRYFIIIDAVMNGRAAVFDEDRNALIPIHF